MQAVMQQRCSGRQACVGPSGRAAVQTPQIVPPSRLLLPATSAPAGPQPCSEISRRASAVRSTPAEAVVHQDEFSAPSSSGSSESKSISTSNVWEIDFCSRPLLDERGKKVWELLICDPQRTFEYSEFFPNSKINSGEMQTIITKALTECDIKPVPSRRCFTVMSWIQERLETVYKKDPRYSDKAQTLFALDLGPPEPLPDALRGEQWAFVQIPLYQLLGMLKRVEQGETFGSTFDLQSVGADKLPKDILIPGVAVFSRRALPLSAWTNGLEIAAIKADVARASLILETGVNQRWRYGGWRPNQDAIDEAENWEDCKQGVMGLHFLAVQPDPDSEQLSGLWLLLDKAPPSI